MDSTAIASSRRNPAAELNPAGNAYSEQDYKDGTVQRHVDELHALTLQGHAEEAQHSHADGALALMPATFHFHALPNVVVGLLPPFLTHWEARAFGTTSRRNSAIVATDKAFDLTRQALSVGALRMTRQLMDTIHRLEVAMDATPPSTLDQLEGEAYWEVVATIRAYTAAKGQLDLGLTQAQEAEVIRILGAGPGHQVHCIALQRCDRLLELLDIGPVAAIERAALTDSARPLGRAELVELRQAVLMLAAQAIVGGEVRPGESPPA